MIQLTDKVAIVTGGARGIGKSIALKLAQAGANIVICDVLDNMTEAVSEIETLGRKALAVKADITNAEDVQAVMEKTLATFSRIDILVNNAGITRDNLLIRMSEDEWDAVIRVNLKGTFICLKAAAKIMMKQRAGTIINISSVVGVMGNAGQANYSASKGGVISLTKSAAKELAGRGVTVNAVAPGYIQTEMTNHLPEKAKETFMSVVPLKRPGTADDVANAVLFLSSDLASYTTGQVLHVDGGMIM
ncbi:3-oxoacyl-[acyl-carrier-protein] reductase [candidate division KSB1 bacterium]|nr:3-oxoacyl-[acyl-carrier-protein] reductase [candidate division KSB1 bacterium]